MSKKQKIKKPAQQKTVRQISEKAVAKLTGSTDEEHPSLTDSIRVGGAQRTFIHNYSEGNLKYIARGEKKGYSQIREQQRYADETKKKIIHPEKGKIKALVRALAVAPVPGVASTLLDGTRPPLYRPYP
ncbi:MAG: hypothetical protein AB4352_12680 [Hormoscilla sp.]